MAENNRNISIFLLVLALMGAALFYGCGSATSDSIPAIEFSISGSYSSEGLTSVNVSSTRAVSGLAAGILIYSESDPTNYADIDETNKTYLIKNLKPGTHYIVFRHIPNGIYGKNYIYRSSKPVVLTDASPAQVLNEVLRATEGTISITGKVTNTNGQLITPTPTLTLWGQTIEVNPITGEFTTPLMPERTTADLIINAINYQQTSVPLVFESNPAYYEFTAVDTTNNNVPPTVSLSSKNSKYNVKSTVTFNAVAQDLNNDELTFIWEIESCTANDKGILELSSETQEGSTYKSEYYWTAPEDDCMATITVKVVEKNTLQQLSAKAKLKIQIGTGEYHPNTKPQIISTNIYPQSLYGSRNYTVTLIATDTDGDVLTNSLSITPANGTLSKTSGNTWSWKTPDLESSTAYTLAFVSKDPRGNIASLTRTVNVGKTQPNADPVIVSQNPSSVANIMSGRELALTLVANDPENETLSFIWSSTFGELTQTSKNGGTASATWLAPYVNVNTSTKINCTVSDPQGSIAIATFSITVAPDPAKMPPDITINMSGTDVVVYNTDILLFKAGETMKLAGMATDSNQHISIENPTSYKWEYRCTDYNPEDLTGSNEYKLITQSNVAELPITSDITPGNYIIRLSVTDANGITGEQTKQFRVNSLPIAEIICNGNAIGSDGRMTTHTASEFDIGGIKYDVFNYNVATPSFTASCTDIETDPSVIQSYARWVHNGELKTGATYRPTITATGTNVLELTTRDSKGEWSATATYQYFVNSAPVFDVATSTKIGFIDADTITLDVSVRDDAPGLSLTWYFCYKSESETNYSDYIKMTGIGNNPVETEDNMIAVSIATSANDLLALGNDFKIKLVATDKMGLQTENNDIIFSVITPHTIKPFTVASGTYYSNQEPSSFEQLIQLYGTITKYDFEANQAFSIKSGATDYESAMTWVWTDNGSDIGEAFVDSSAGYILNGYTISDQFGTHTIKLEGTSIDYGIKAENSIEIFINSTPQIEFKNATNDTIRFDTGCNATFSVTLREDNPNEALSLIWTVYDLDKNCEEITDQSIPSPKVFVSNPIQPTSGKSPVYMAGVNEKTVTINWSDITTEQLASGAKRVYVCAADAYGKAATASVDILVNTLPVFVNVVGERKVKIEVPNTASDSGEDYQYFKEQYATTTTDIPVFLVAGNPSMEFNFTSNAYDAEYPTFFDEHEENITWHYTYVDPSTGEKIPMSLKGKSVHGRFPIGANTVNVECRDFFYNYYSKDGDSTIYNHMCIATCSEDFYLWQSMAWEFDGDVIKTNSLVDAGTKLFEAYTANTLYQTTNNHFMVTFGTPGEPENCATYTVYFELSPGINHTCFVVNPGFVTPLMEFFMYESNSYKSTDPRTIDLPLDGNIITLQRFNENEYIMLTKTIASSPAYTDGVTQLFTRYNDDINDKDEYWSDIASYSAFLIEDTDDGDYSKYKAYRGYEAGHPSDDKYAERIISMTYCDASDDTAGAMLLHNWKGTTDVLAAYKNDRKWFLDDNNSHPLYALDGTNLRLTSDSKVRFLNKLSNDLSQKLFVTDTMNNRIIRCDKSFTNANTIVSSYPVDVCTTNSEYLFSLTGSDGGFEKGLTLYAIDNGSATALVHFADQISSSDPLKANFNYRAGKVLNPKSIIYYTVKNGENYYGGLMILEEGRTRKNRIQLIRSNKGDWLK